MLPPASLSKKGLSLIAILSAVMLSACTQTVTPPTSPALSSAVKYQTKSKEYPLLSRFVYTQATHALPAFIEANQVVVMDVDETILDNSQYERERELLGLGYSSASWQAWVERAEATLVPGAREFLAQVIGRGGKVALITNRDKSLDDATWQNLMSLGLPLTPDNTCLLGRGEVDKLAVNGTTIINDKDLRRQQLQQGIVDCSNATQASVTRWQNPQQLLMQIGDNIEDFAGTTQHDADLDALLPQVGSELFLLPNPMYGSW